MRASLVSATSLLALLLSEGAQGAATVSWQSGTDAFGNVLVGSTATNSVGFTESSGPANTITVTGATSPFGPTTAQTFAMPSTSGTNSWQGTFSFGPLTTGAATSTVALYNNLGSNTATLTLTGTGVAPLASVTASALTNANNGYILVGNSGAVTLTVSNIGNGNLVSGSGGNLVGSIGSTNSVFVGTTSAFTLNDSHYTTLNGTSYGTSTTNTYTFAPTVTGAASTVVTTTLANGMNASNAAGAVLTTLTATAVAPVQSVASLSGTAYVRAGTSATISALTVSNIGNGNKSSTIAGVGNLTGTVTNALGARVTAASSGTISLADAATSTLAYTYAPTARGAAVSTTATLAFTDGNSAGTNASQTVSSVFLAQGVGPSVTAAYSRTSTGAGSVSLVSTPTANGSVGAASGTISFGSVGYQKSVTIYLALQNTTTDSLAAASLTNLTIESYSIAGAASVSVGSVVAQGATLLLPITITDTTAGVYTLNSSLTIFTDESAALGGVGDTFTYSLTALAVPEPTSLAVLGAGLAGLASMRRRRRR